MAGRQEHHLDEIPHAVIGLTAFYTFVLAAVLMVLWSGERRATAAAIVVLAMPLVVSRLARKAGRERDGS